jgi:2-oxoglutarate dehydrogenase E2 component (dihydrolipoamide succinyltransferase)
MQIRVPPLGESITEATISRWLKREGDAVVAGQTLVELETDKITVEVPAMKGGVLLKLLKAEGDVVKVDEVLCDLDENAAAAGAPAATAVAAAAAAPAPAPVPAQSPSSAADVRSAPSARRLADEAGVNLAGVTGTGRGGVVSKPDVMAAMSAPAAVPAAAQVAVATPAVAAVSRPPSVVPLAAGERESREKMTTRRKRIAENLLQAQHATAHLTTFNEIDMSVLAALRERMKEKVEKEHGVKLSFMPFFAKAACLALKAFPTVNAQIDGETIIYKHYVNLGIAVASEAGLVVPNVKDADRKGLLDISRDIAALAKKARDTKLTMDDLTGGTFTITNGGVFGSLISTPIINYPQVAILGLHKTQDRPVAVNGQVVIRPMMYVALSYDHRIIDGQQAVLFLVRMKELLEDPATMLID